MILDEPMSALDIGKQIDLLKVFHELIHEGKIIIVTTHKSYSCFSYRKSSMFYKSRQYYDLWQQRTYNYAKKFMERT